MTTHMRRWHGTIAYLNMWTSDHRLVRYPAPDAEWHRPLPLCLYRPVGYEDPENVLCGSITHLAIVNDEVRGSGLVDLDVAAAVDACLRAGLPNPACFGAEMVEVRVSHCAESGTDTVEAWKLAGATLSRNPAWAGTELRITDATRACTCDYGRALTDPPMPDPECLLHGNP